MQRKEGHMKTEAEVGVILSQNTQDKECLRLPEVGRGKEESSPRGCRGSIALPTPRLRLLACRPVRE